MQGRFVLHMHCAVPMHMLHGQSETYDMHKQSGLRPGDAHEPPTVNKHRLKSHSFLTMRSAKPWLSAVLPIFADKPSLRSNGCLNLLLQNDAAPLDQSRAKVAHLG